MKKTTSSLLAAISLLLSLLIFSGCASTVMEETWTHPAVDAFTFEKLLLLALAEREDDRRFAESAMARQITRIPTIRSHDILPGPDAFKDPDKVIETVKTSGADGVVVVRLANLDSRVSRGRVTAHPLDYATFSDYFGVYYDVSAFFATDARAINIDNLFYFEIRIFDVETGELLWSGQTKTTKSTDRTPNIEGLIAEISEVVKAALAREGLIP
jgi:hypothetical protein